MKAATGELNLTVITIIAIGLVLAFFTTLLWPTIKNSISGSWNNASRTNVTSYVEVVDSDLM